VKGQRSGAAAPIQALNANKREPKGSSMILGKKNHFGKGAYH
jgi:hypothetical protein